ncbi:TonB-dependent receptor [Arenibacter sp. GZD96]|uniref:SusC/RagA family TonB-linked outer membrane protein n=1 Tax=Aurantibrevibacter litoralis TaxID=3106030 RepID=UPI002AFE06AC|nr:TonB-dependent receptor [Arenibacter sp. GZD-96]MEA1786215.1 TonB-dependent receptor [Arenibacter sp. GZD-96]
MMKIKITFFALLLLTMHNVLSQNSTVTGVVSDETGAPLPGASIQVSGTSNGTQTDFDGNYTLSNVPSNATLVYSYIGFVTQRVALNGRTTVNISLEEDLQKLDEVVLIGYGTQRKEAVTGAVSTVSAEAVTALPVVSFAEALQGRASGVQVTNSGGPGTDPIVQIRGIGSISFASSPLYVVDGYPVGGLTDFDNNDIESMTILKDASAAAIYGSRAANGVILVTTKRGRTTGDVKFTYRGFTGFAQAAKRLDLLNREQYLQFGRELLGNAGATFPSRWSQLDTPIFEGATQTFAQTDTDYQDEVFETGITTSHSLSVRGGSEKSRVFSSFGYFRQDGIIVGTGFTRYNFRVNSDHDINNWLTIGQSLTISTSERLNEAELGGRTQIQNIIRGIPYIPIRDPTLPGGLRAPDGADGTDPENPLRGGLIDKNINRNVRIFGTAYAQVKIFDGFSYKFTAGIDWNNFRNLQLQPIYFDGFAGRNENITIDNQSTSTGNYFSNQLSYEKQWGEHKLDVIAVAEEQDFFQNTITGQGRRLSNDLNVLSGTQAQTVQGTEGENQIFSFLGRVNYDFGGKYLLSASLRRDGSSKFSEDNKWRTFPGISAGWNIAQESFMDGFENLSELKLRGSWGKIGFEGIGNFESQAGISTNTNAIIDNQEVQGAFFNRLANSELEWEITKMTNIGLDLGLYQNRWQFTAEWYERNTDNLILAVPLPPSLGFSGSTIANVGGMENWGLDFSTSYFSKPGTDFQWNVSANLSLNRNEVTALATDSGTIFAGNNADTGGFDITRTAVGDPIQSFFGWRIDGIFQSQEQIAQFNALDGDANTPYQANAAPGDLIFRDLDGSGSIDADDREVIGSFIPDFTYGLNFDASYKNFSLSLYIYGNQGNDVYNATKVFTEGGLRLFNHGTNVLNAWTPTNTNTNVPRMINGDPNQNTRTSDRFVEDASFLRLQSLRVGYTIPKDWLSRSIPGVENMNFYVSGNNLFTITGYDGFDPEIGARNNNLNIQGIDFGQYPRAPTILMGVEVGF